MRRTAVGLTWLALCFGCTERWVLPGSTTDAGRGADSGASASGGRNGPSGGGGTAGIFGQGRGSGGAAGLPCHDSDRLDHDISKAQMVFSVGRNSSMSEPFGDGTRMSVVQQTLQRLVTANQNAVNFGYQDFPSSSTCGSGVGCCSNSFPVYPAPGNSVRIDEALRDCEGGFAMSGCVSALASRPVADALKKTISKTSPLFAPDERRDRYIVLLVDGAPGCSMENSIDSCNAARMQISQLKTALIGTYVIPLGETAEADSCLRMMAADSGVGTNLPLQGKTATLLEQTLTQLVKQAAAAACVITLSSPLPTPPRQLELTIKDDVVKFDATGTDGWNLMPGPQPKIQVYGPACQRLQNIQKPSDVAVFSVCGP